MYEIKLFKGIETKEVIGLSKAEVREKLGKPMDEWPLFFSGDAFGYYEYHVYFNKEGICEAIELFEEVQLSLCGKKIMGISKDEALSILGKSGPVCDDGYAIYFLELSLGLSCPDGVVVAICVGKKDYYKSDDDCKAERLQTEYQSICFDEFTKTTKESPAGPISEFKCIKSDTD